MAIVGYTSSRKTTEVKQLGTWLGDGLEVDAAPTITVKSQKQKKGPPLYALPPPQKKKVVE